MYFVSSHKFLSPHGIRCTIECHGDWFHTFTLSFTLHRSFLGKFFQMPLSPSSYYFTVWILICPPDVRLWLSHSKEFIASIWVLICIQLSKSLHSRIHIEENNHLECTLHHVAPYLSSCFENLWLSCYLRSKVSLYHVVCHIKIFKRCFKILHTFVILHHIFHDDLEVSWERIVFLIIP